MKQEIKEQTREQKLEAALLQMIELATTVRFRQRRFDEEYGSENKYSKDIANAMLDTTLKNMGVDEHTDFKLSKIKFSKDLKVDETEDLSKKLIK